MSIQKLYITSGLNTDASPETIKSGEGPYRINVRVMSSENGDEQASETMNGNTIVAFTLPAGTNKVIGAKEYLIGKKIYYFVYNSSGNHLILEYDEVLGTIAKVLQNILLGFLSTKLITGINIIELDSTNHLLYWTDNNEEPRKINIEKGKYHTAGNFTLGYPATFTEEFIYRIKHPMPLSPATVYGNDSTRVVNRLDKKLFQFKVQNGFDDKEVSSWSPISKTVFPELIIQGSGNQYLFVGYNNKISVTIDTGSEIVKSLRIAVKEFGNDNFKLVVDLNKEREGIASNTTYTYSFYNEGNYVPLEVNESIKLFDNIPKKSQSQELIYGNRMVDGLITEGFNAVPIDLKIGYTLDPVYITPVERIVNALKRGGVYTYGIIYYDHGNRSGATNINEGRFDTVQSNGEYGSTLFIPFYTEGTPGLISINYTGLSGGVFAVGDPVVDAAGTGTGIIVSDNGSTMVIGTITGDWIYPGGTVAQTLGPVYATTVSIGVSPVGGYVPSVDWTIFNEAPSWATHYQLARVKNATSDRYIQWEASGVLYLNAAGVSVAYGSATAVTLELNILSITGAFKTSNPGSILVYDYAKGDRIRFIYKNGTTLLDNFIDLEVSSFDSATGLLHVGLPPEIYPGFFTALTGNILFEIYQPQLTTATNNKLTYEIACGGTVAYDATRGHYIHSGTTNNQLTNNFTSATYGVPPTMVLALSVGHGLLATNVVKITSNTDSYSVYGTVASVTANSATITTSTTLVGTFDGSAGTVSKGAKGVFSGGDTFYRIREMPISTTLIEDANYSDLYSSQGYDYGRPNRIDPNFKEVTRLSTVYWSGQFVPETFINGLSTVYDTSFQTYEDKYGGIYRLYAEDQSLMVFQELKIGGALVQQIIIDSGNGNSLIGASENILSTKINYYAGEYGIGKHPESFAVYGNAKYGIDVLRGVIWRLSNNGLTPISDTGNISSFTRDQCDAVLSASSKVNIYGVYDTRFEEYIIAFDGFNGRLTEVAAKTLAWNEEKNAWSTFYSYAPEMMVSKGIDLVTFKAGALYTHNTNVLQANFYGVQYKPSVWLYANAFPSNIKVFKAISLESDTAWNVTVETPSTQTTSMVSNNFKLKEGLMYSEILRDDNTVNVLNPRFNGSPMRGQWALVKLEYQGTDFNKLFAVNVLMIPSNRSNK